MNRFNVRSNCISPFAWSRLIGTIPTETPEEKARVERMQRMTADKIAPICAYLLGDAAKDVTGQIFAVRMNEISNPLGAAKRGLDAAEHCRARHAGAEGIVLQARSLR